MYMFYPIIAWIVFVSVAIYLSKGDEKKYEIEKVDHGKMSKMEYDDHTYVIWSSGFTNIVLHDPSCKCIKNMGGE